LFEANGEAESEPPADTPEAAWTPEEKKRRAVVKDEPQEDTNREIKKLGVGVRYANEAINSLIRIPKNDALRKRGFEIVADWIKHNR
jgi:hypothetical protein